MGWTALQTAAINQKEEIIKILLANGADVNAGDNFVNVYRTAMEKGLDSLDGIHFVLLYCYIVNTKNCNKYKKHNSYRY